MRNIYFQITILLLLFLVIFLIRGGSEVFKYKFDSDIVGAYKNSQDIPHEVESRVYLSDSDIYVASGYLYAQGSDPTLYNFQHPPAIKYLYGLSIKVFNNPYFVQIYFALGLLAVTFLLAYRLTDSYSASWLSSLFLVADPVFNEVANHALLDLGQSFLFISFLYLFLYKRKTIALPGVVLGLLISSKFYSGVLLMIFFVYGCDYYFNKTKPGKHDLYTWLIAIVVFNLTYTVSYIEGGLFAPLLNQLKSIKFMLTHNTSLTYFSTLALFFTGNIDSWWGDGGKIYSEVWSILWPVGLITSVIHVARKRIYPNTMVFLLPVFYFLISATQLPFTRYFILIIPFIYIAFSETILALVKHGRRIFINR